MMNLFTYGTLMWPEVLEGVVGRPLDGYIRRRIKGVHYPAVIPSDANQVEGLLYEGLTAVDFRHPEQMRPAHLAAFYSEYKGWTR